MTFSYTRNIYTPDAGGLAIATGTYTNASGDTGGKIDTCLHEVLFFNTNNKTSQATTETLVAISGGRVTITTVGNEDGKWWAIGS